MQILRKFLIFFQTLLLFKAISNPIYFRHFLTSSSIFPVSSSSPMMVLSKSSVVLPVSHFFLYLLPVKKVFEAVCNLRPLTVSKVFIVSLLVTYHEPLHLAQIEVSFSRTQLFSTYLSIFHLEHSVDVASPLYFLKFESGRWHDFHLRLSWAAKQTDWSTIEVILMHCGFRFELIRLNDIGSHVSR